MNIQQQVQKLRKDYDYLLNRSFYERDDKLFGELRKEMKIIRAEIDYLENDYEKVMCIIPLSSGRI